MARIWCRCVWPTVSLYRQQFSFREPVGYSILYDSSMSAHGYYFNHHERAIQKDVELLKTWLYEIRGSKTMCEMMLSQRIERMLTRVMLQTI